MDSCAGTETPGESRTGATAASCGKWGWALRPLSISPAAQLRGSRSTALQQQQESPLGPWRTRVAKGGPQLGRFRLALFSLFILQNRIFLNGKTAVLWVLSKLLHSGPCLRLQAFGLSLSCPVSAPSGHPSVLAPSLPPQSSAPAAPLPAPPRAGSSRPRLLHPGTSVPPDRDTGWHSSLHIYHCVSAHGPCSKTLNL